MSNIRSIYRVIGASDNSPLLLVSAMFTVDKTSGWVTDNNPNEKMQSEQFAASPFAGYGDSTRMPPGMCGMPRVDNARSFYDRMPAFVTTPLNYPQGFMQQEYPRFHNQPPMGTPPDINPPPPPYQGFRYTPANYVNYAVFLDANTLLFHVIDVSLLYDTGTSIELGNPLYGLFPFNLLNKNVQLADRNNTIVKPLSNFTYNNLDFASSVATVGVRVLVIYPEEREISNITHRDIYLKLSDTNVVNDAELESTKDLCITKLRFKLRDIAAAYGTNHTFDRILNALTYLGEDAVAQFTCAGINQSKTHVGEHIHMHEVVQWYIKNGFKSIQKLTSVEDVTKTTDALINVLCDKTADKPNVGQWHGVFNKAGGNYTPYQPVPTYPPYPDLNSVSGTDSENISDTETIQRNNMEVVVECRNILGKYIKSINQRPDLIADHMEVIGRYAMLLAYLKDTKSMYPLVSQNEDFHKYTLNNFRHIVEYVENGFNLILSMSNEEAKAVLVYVKYLFESEVVECNIKPYLAWVQWVPAVAREGSMRYLPRNTILPLPERLINNPIATCSYYVDKILACTKRVALTQDASDTSANDVQKNNAIVIDDCKKALKNYIAAIDPENNHAIMKALGKFAIILACINDVCYLRPLVYHDQTFRNFLTDNLNYMNMYVENGFSTLQEYSNEEAILILEVIQELLLSDASLASVERCLSWVPLVSQDNEVSYVNRDSIFTAPKHLVTNDDINMHYASLILSNNDYAYTSRSLQKEQLPTNTRVGTETDILATLHKVNSSGPKSNHVLDKVLAGDLDGKKVFVSREEAEGKDNTGIVLRDNLRDLLGKLAREIDISNLGSLYERVRMCHVILNEAPLPKMSKLKGKDAYSHKTMNSMTKIINDDVINGFTAIEKMTSIERDITHGILCKVLSLK